MTAVRPQSFVDVAHMNRECPVLAKRLGAPLTLVRPLLQVHRRDVAGEGALLPKRDAAKLALPRAHAQVDGLDMDVQVALGSKLGETRAAPLRYLLLTADGRAGGVRGRLVGCRARRPGFKVDIALCGYNGRWVACTANAEGWQ